MTDSAEPPVVGGELSRRALLRAAAAAPLAASISGGVAALLASSGPAAASGLASGLASALGLRAGVEGPVTGLEWPITRADYDLDPRVIYLNHASIGTMPRAVREAQEGYRRVLESNPWQFIWNDAWEGAMALSRARVARFMGARPEEVAITRTTTEGMAIVASGLPLGPGDEVLFSSLNHVGAAESFRHWKDRMGYTVREFDFPVHEAASMTPDDVVSVYVEQIRENTRLLVFPHIDNILGILYPARRLVEAARARGVEFVVVDGAQSVGMLPVDVSAIGADVYVNSPHKWIQSPKQVGVMHVRKELIGTLRPAVFTWGAKDWANEARRYEDFGTRDPSIPLALGDAVAFQERVGIERSWARRLAWMGRVMSMAEASGSCRVIGPRHPELRTAITAIEPIGRSAGAMADDLFNQHGVLVRASTRQGLNGLRVSVNQETEAWEIDRFFELV